MTRDVPLYYVPCTMAIQIRMMLRLCETLPSPPSAKCSSLSRLSFVESQNYCAVLFPASSPLICSGHDISMVLNILLAGLVHLSQPWPLPAP